MTDGQNSPHEEETNWAGVGEERELKNKAQIHPGKSD